MFIDLDGFKDVNDTLRPPVGDELLRAVATRIAGVLRESDTIGRLGGDEFVVLVEGDAGCRRLAHPRGAARAVRRSARGRRPISITGSIGIASGDREAAKDLLRDADIALYEAKGAGRNRYAEFRHEMQIAAHDRMALENDLRGAIDARRAVPRLPADPRPRRRRGRRAPRRCCAGSTRRAGSSRRPSSSRSPRRAALIVAIGAWVLRDRVPAGGALARRRPPDPRRRQRLHPPARRSRRCSTRVAARARRERARPRPLDARDHRDGADARPGGRRRRPARAARRSACASRSTTSAPATPRSPTCSSCRSTRSRSTARSSPSALARVGPLIDARPARPQPGAAQRRRGHRGRVASSSTCASSGATRGQGYLFAPPLDAPAFDRYLNGAPAHAGPAPLRSTASSSTA